MGQCRKGHVFNNYECPTCRSERAKKSRLKNPEKRKESYLKCRERKQLGIPSSKKTRIWPPLPKEPKLLGKSITINGETRNYKQWFERYGVYPKVLESRIRNRCPEGLLLSPYRVCKRFHEYIYVPGGCPECAKLPIRARSIPAYKPRAKRIYSEDKEFYVYLYLRGENSTNGLIGTPYYVGKGKGERASQKRHRIQHPKDPSNIVLISQNMSEMDAFQLEVLLIFLWGRIDLKTGCLHNRTHGGDGLAGYVRPEGYIPKNILKGESHPMYGKPSPKRGTVLSEEYKKKVSEGLKRYFATKVNTGSMPLSEEHKKKISDGVKGEKHHQWGKPISEATKLKLSLANKGKHQKKKTD